MPRVVRSIDAFYEVDGSYAVSRDRAQEIYRAATEAVSQYVGPVVLSSLRGARLPRNDRPVNPYKLRLGDAPHTALLTGRGTETDRSGYRRYGGFAAIRSRGMGGARGSVVAATVPEPAIDSTGLIALDTLVHELGHSFDLDDGARATCAMNGIVRVAANSVLLRQFCDSCAGDLELAGYQALAAQLK